MSETKRLLRHLKKEMRRQGKTYAQAAEVLGLSEASVKRLFSREQFSLQRLERICDWLQLRLIDLVQLMEDSRRKVEQLTPEQEAVLVSDTKLLLITQAVLNHWTAEEITQTYQITEPEAIQRLVQLDRMGLIELLPGNRIRLLIARDFHWRAGGAIERFFEQRIQGEFFASGFDQAGESRRVISGMLSERASAQVQRRIERLVSDFHALHLEDQALAIGERQGTSLVVAMRPWEPSVFARLRRTPNDEL